MQDATPTGRTELSLEVDDTVAEVRDLEEHGVTFADYDLPGLKTAAWIEDPDGNVLCLHEAVAHR